MVYLIESILWFYCLVFFLGLLGVKLHNSLNEENLLIDAAQLIINTFTKLLDYPSLFWFGKASVLDCSTTEPWSYGTDVYRYILFFSRYIKEIFVF
jgi:hypothetical protein